jgi:hypothetical protein
LDRSLEAGLIFHRTSSAQLKWAVQSVLPTDISFLIAGNTHPCATVRRQLHDRRFDSEKDAMTAIAESAVAIAKEDYRR